MKVHGIFSALVSSLMLIAILSESCLAQSKGLPLCLNKATKKVVAKSFCSKNETEINSANLLLSSDKPSTVSGSINYASCYQTSARKSASSYDGRIGVGLLCRDKNDLLLNDQFDVSETSGAKPALERKRIILNNNIPNGVEYGMIATAGGNRFYEVRVAATCCPFSK